MLSKKSLRTSPFFAIILWSMTVSLLAEEQVSELKVRHRSGQTFLTWKEVDPPEVTEEMDMKYVRDALLKNAKQKICYSIYRSTRPIATVKGLKPVGMTGQLSCWNTDFHGIYPKKGQKVFRRKIDADKPPLRHGVGVYVHNPRGTGTQMEAYYAVTCSINGKENRSITPANATKRPILEHEGQGVPVLQRIVRPVKHFNYVEASELHYYVRWEAPPNASVENKPIDYVVAVPKRAEKPAPVGLHLHCWGGSLNGGYGWWYSYLEKGTTFLIASNQIPYDWWTGYHELLYDRQGKRLHLTEKLCSEGKVRPYSTARMLSFLDWAAEKYDLDKTRVFTAGNSMGGSGAPMFAIRYPERIAWSIGWVGVHDPGETPHFKGSYEQVYGKEEWRTLFVDGTPVFDHYNDSAYLRRHPEKEIGFVTWSNGKNDGGIGWPQAVELYRAMQETKRPHLFVWGMSGHGTRAVMPAGSPTSILPIDLRTDRSLPAFTRCSLDDDPGTATKLARPKQFTERNGKQKPDVYDGDSVGQVNRYLYWETKTIVDTKDRWEITVGLSKDAPEKECTVDVTPRRLQLLKAKPGERFRWTNRSAGKEVQSGTARADQHGLVTIEKVRVGKETNRIQAVRISDH